jgi:hypothetical protein
LIRPVDQGASNVVTGTQPPVPHASTVHVPALAP